MSSNTKNQFGYIVMAGGAFLFLSSFWVEDKDTAVNRRMIGLAAAAGSFALINFKK